MDAKAEPNNDAPRGPRRLVATYEFEAGFPPGTDGEYDDLLLRLELWQFTNNRTKYAVRLWRLEYFRVQSTFPQKKGVPIDSPSDELICVEKPGFLSLMDDVVDAATEEEAFQRALKLLHPHIKVVMDE